MESERVQATENRKRVEKPAVAKALKTDTRFSSTQWKRLDTEDLQAGVFALADGEFFVINTALESESPVTDMWTADFLSPLSTFEYRMCAVWYQP